MRRINLSKLNNLVAEISPEHRVRLAEYSCTEPNRRHHHHHLQQATTSDGASECSASEESSNECPEELYNLTKLAEVSLAAAAGTLVHPKLYQLPNYEPERTKSFYERIESERENLIELKTRRIEKEDKDSLRETVHDSRFIADEFKVSFIFGSSFYLFVHILT